jgi:hypothetical protein
LLFCRVNKKRLLWTIRSPIFTNLQRERERENLREVLACGTASFQIRWWVMSSFHDSGGMTIFLMLILIICF